MGLCFGERQRLKGEAHTPRGDALFAPVQRIEKGKSGESKSFGVRTRKDLFSQEEMEQPHNRRNRQQQMIFVFTHCTPRCTTLDTSSTCKTAASKRTQFLACGAPPLAVVTFESNLNDESKSSCWSLLAREKKANLGFLIVVCGKKRSSREWATDDQ